MLIAERDGQGLRLTNSVEGTAQLDDRDEGVAQLEAEIDRCLELSRALRELGQRVERVLEVERGLPVGSPFHRLGCRARGPGRPGAAPPATPGGGRRRRPRG